MIFKRKKIIGNRIKSPFFMNETLIVTNYITDNLWEFRFETPLRPYDEITYHWANTPYSYFEENGLVIEEVEKRSRREQRLMDAMLWEYLNGVGEDEDEE